MDQRYDVISAEVTEMRNAIQILTQKISEVIERDAGDEVLAREEWLNKSIEYLSKEVTELRNIIQTTELQSKQYDGISEEMSEMRNVFHYLTQKVAEHLEQDTISSISDKEQSLNQRFDDISQQLTSQQRLLDKIAKLLGF
jgi:altronate dehydratase